MPYRQYELREATKEPCFETMMVCWIEDDPRLRVGTQVTLKQIPDVRWEVVKRYQTVLDHVPWTRWEVGGL